MAVIDGILHRVRTGVQRRDLPERFGSWKTVYARHRLWSADGTWERLFQQVQAAANVAGEIDWDVSVDSTIVRAHPRVGRSEGRRPTNGRRPPVPVAEMTRRPRRWFPGPRPSGCWSLPLEGEIADHLGYDKHNRPEPRNAYETWCTRDLVLDWADEALQGPTTATVLRSSRSYGRWPSPSTTMRCMTALIPSRSPFFIWPASRTATSRSPRNVLVFLSKMSCSMTPASSRPIAIPCRPAASTASWTTTPGIFAVAR